MILISSIHPAASSSLTSELWEHVLRRTSVISVRRHSFIANTTAHKTPEKALRGCFIKVKDPSDDESSPLCLEHASKEARRTSTRHTSQWWYHHRPFVMRKRSEFWKECLTDDVLKKTALILPSCCSPQERSLWVRGNDVRSEWRL